MSAQYTEGLPQYVAMAKTGDVSAFTQLVKASQNVTTSIALSIVKDTDASEDVAQQVYIKIWQQLPTLKDEHSFLPWLRQVTRYTAFNYLRDNKVTSRVTSEEADILFTHMSSAGDDEVAALDKRQINQHLIAFIEALPEESRELVLLYYREEQSTQQVATLLELTEANVRKKLSRVRQQLKAQWLAKYGKLVLSTAPTLTFTSLVAGVATTSTPVAAASLSSSLSAGKSGVWAKAAAVFSGVAIAGAMGCIAVLLSTKMLLNNIHDASYRPMILRYRNLMIGWIVLWSVVMSMSYELTSGWWAPVVSYVFFGVGLVRLIELTQLLSIQAGLKQQGKWCISNTSSRVKIIIMNSAGPIIGLICMLIGLHNAGRLFV